METNIIQEIKQLKDKGQLKDALDLSLKVMECEPSLMLKRQLAWIYDAYCKQYAEIGDFDAFLDTFRCIVALSLSNELTLNKSLCWRLYKLSINVCGDTETLSHKFYLIYEMARRLNVPTNSKSYLQLFRIFYRVRDWWDGYLVVCDWWGLDNFTDDCYKCDDDNSLVDSALISYVDAVENSNDIECQNKCLALLKLIRRRHKESNTVAYLLGKQMIAMRLPDFETLSYIQNILRQNPNNEPFWNLFEKALKQYKFSTQKYPRWKMIDENFRLYILDYKFDTKVTVVKYVNRESHFAHIIYDYKCSAMINCDYVNEILDIGMFLRIRITELKDNGWLEVSEAVKTEECPSTRFYKEVEGIVETDKSMTSFYLRTIDNKLIYIPNYLCEAKTIRIGDKLSAKIAYANNSQSTYWNWVCLSVDFVI